MSIIRSPRKESNFYVLDKRISEDKRLSWAARGLLVYLLGKPDHWNVSVEALQNETASSGRPTRRDGVYTLINELMAVGYVKREKKRIGGAFTGYDYTVSEEALPCTDQPYTVAPSTPEPTLVSIEVKQEMKDSKDAGRPATRTRAKKEETTIEEWMQSVNDSGQKIIPSTDTIWTDGIPVDFILLAWKVFESDMISSGQRKKDWRAQFRTYVRRDYLKLWAMNRQGDYYLTTAGKQAAQRFEMGDLIDG